MGNGARRASSSETASLRRGGRVASVQVLRNWQPAEESAMADETPPRRRRTIASPEAAAVVTDTDADNAVRQWREDAPPSLRGLLDAVPVEE